MSDIDSAPLTEAERASAKKCVEAEDEWKPLVPAPDGIAQGIPPHRLGTPSATWDYRDDSGRLLFRTCRFDHIKDGKPAKDVIPLCYCEAPDGRREWRWKAPPEPRPLYGAERLAARPNADVIVVEGEKKCVPAETLFPDFVAVTSQGGSGAAAKSDWSLVKGRRVAVWADNDAAGLKYARNVVQLVLKAGAVEAWTVTVPASFPRGWDLADRLPDGCDAGRLRKLLDAAEILAESNDDPVPGYNMTSDGLYFDPGENKPPIHVAGPFKVVAQTRDADGQAWGILLKWADADGHIHEWALPRSMLAGDAADMRARLLDEGLFISPSHKARELLTSYLTLVQRRARARCVDRAGWHDGVYVMPQGSTFGATAGDRVVLQAPTPPKSLEQRGTLEGWQTDVAALAVGNTRLVLAICAAFVGPLLRFAGEASFGFHFVGRSSIGKTIALRLAGSAWGRSMDTWRTTDNGLEALASAANDGLLMLDELSQVNAGVAEAISYMLGNERGKGRINRAIAVRPALSWHLAFLSTGELTMADKMAEIGHSARAGQGVRMIEIAADAGAGHGIFENLHGYINGAALARHLEEAAERHRGLAIPAFLARLVQGPQDIGTVLQQACNEWCDEYLPPDADGQVHRVARRFALTAAAGELAAAMGILPWPRDEAKRATGKCFKDWLRERGGTGPAEVADGVAAVRAFIVAHGASRFESISDAGCGDDKQRTLNRVGFRRQNAKGEFEFLIFPVAWRNEVCGGRNPKVIAAELLRMGVLLKDSEGKTSRSETLPGLGKKRMYVITSAILGEEDGHA